MPQDTASELPTEWIKRERNLLGRFNDMYRLMKRVHSGGGAANQCVQRSESVSQGRHSIVVTVLPLGVEVEYSANASEVHGDSVRINQQVVFRGRDTGEKKELHDSYVMSTKDGGIVLLKEDHPIRKGAASMDAGKVFPLMLRSYEEILFGQCKICSEKKGVSTLPLQLVGGVPGFGRRLNLAQIYLFNKPDGSPYNRAELDERVLSVLDKHSPDLAQVEHDGLYIIDKDTLIDCGDSSLLEGMVSKHVVGGVNNKVRMKSAHEQAREWMSVYEHDDAIIRIVDRILPESGAVFVYPCAEGIVSKIFDYYVFHPQEDEQAVLDDSLKWLSLDEDGLRIRFLGDIAESELKGLLDTYTTCCDKIKTRRNIKSMREDFVFCAPK